MMALAMTLRLRLHINCNIQYANRPLLDPFDWKFWTDDALEMQLVRRFVRLTPSYSPA